MTGQPGIALSREDRETLVNLRRKVDELAGMVARLVQVVTTDYGLVNGAGACSNQSLTEVKNPMRNTAPPMPDPKLLRKILKHRRLRGRYWNEQIFADPAWDMILDLAVAEAEHMRVSVTSLCIASGVAPTTALRWIAQLQAEGVFQREEDCVDRRRAYVSLTDKGRQAVSRYFAEIAANGSHVI